MTLGITGAGGQLGQLVVRHLIARGTPPDTIVALVRRPDAAGELAALGVEVRAFDYDQERGLADQLEGVGSLLLISGNAFGKRATQHRAVIDAAKSAGVPRLVYTSAARAEVSINPVSPEHVLTEEYLASSGLRHAILRNGWYHENSLGDLAAAAATGQVVTAAADGRVASASRSNLAEAAAVVLADDRLDGLHTLTGDIAWDVDDLARDISTLLARPVDVVQVKSEEKLRNLTQAGVDDGLAGFLVAVDAAIAAGELSATTGELSGLIGHPTESLLSTLQGLWSNQPDS